MSGAAGLQAHCNAAATAGARFGISVPNLCNYAAIRHFLSQKPLLAAPDS